MNSTSIRWPASVAVVPYAAPASTISRRHDALGGRLDRDVEEAGPGDLDGRDPVGRLEPALDQRGQVARVGAGPLGQLHRHVGGVVAVTLLPGSLHRHARRDAVGQGERALVRQRRQHVDDRGGELVGSHRPRVSARHRATRIDVGVRYRRPSRDCPGTHEAPDAGRRGPRWKRLRQDSNLRHLVPETSALSPELRRHRRDDATVVVAADDPTTGTRARSNRPGGGGCPPRHPVKCRTRLHAGSAVASTPIPIGAAHWASAASAFWSSPSV